MTGRTNGAAVLAPRPADLTEDEAVYVARLIDQVCPESAVDPREHALMIARTLLSLGVRP